MCIYLFKSFLFLILEKFIVENVIMCNWKSWFKQVLYRKRLVKRNMTVQKKFSKKRWEYPNEKNWIFLWSFNNFNSEKKKNQLHGPDMIIGKVIKPPIEIFETAANVNNRRRLAKQSCLGFWCLEVDFNLLGY